MSLSLFAASTRAPRWRWWRLVLRVGGWAVLSAWSLVLLAWLTLHWGILPRLDEWRPRIERYASREVPVELFRDYADWLIAAGLVQIIGAAACAWFDGPESSRR